MTDRRAELFDQVLDFRTNYITVVLENIFQPHNASAVLRSCDCFGIQTVHIIENDNEYNINPDVTLGSDKWLSMTTHNKHEKNTITAIRSLKDQGYRVVATTPHHRKVNLNHFDVFAGKFALLFGTELNGLSEEAIEESDEFLTIPMYGFTESFNISVSAAIILHHLTEKMRSSELDWQLTSEEKMSLKLEWLRKTIRKSDLIEKEFYSAQNKSRNIKR